jgi:hypothetical protein
METHEEIGKEGGAKEGGGAWTQPKHPLYILSFCQRLTIEVLSPQDPSMYKIPSYKDILLPSSLGSSFLAPKTSLPPLFSSIFVNVSLACLLRV